MFCSKTRKALREWLQTLTVRLMHESAGRAIMHSLQSRYWRRCDKGKPVARRARKATGLFQEEVAGLPNSGGVISREAPPRKLWEVQISRFIPKSSSLVLCSTSYSASRRLPT
jgi:hypothetical protein